MIQQYASLVVFLDGWQYSSGCAYEFLVAKRAGIRTLLQDGSLLPVTDGRDLVRAAIDELRGTEVPTDFLESILSELLTLSVSEGELVRTARSAKQIDGSHDETKEQ